MKEISKEYLHSVLNYDKETGYFSWKERNRSLFKSDRAYNAWNNKLKDKRAGNLNTVGYRTIRLHNKNHYEHRLVFIYLYDDNSSKEIDHINNIRDDNKPSNQSSFTFFFLS